MFAATRRASSMVSTAADTWAMHSSPGLAALHHLCIRLGVFGHLDPMLGKPTELCALLFTLRLFGSGDALSGERAEVVGNSLH